MTDVASTTAPPAWRIGNGFKVPEWVEPTAIVLILFGFMYLTRRRNYSVFRRPGDSYFYERVANSAAASPALLSPRTSTDYWDDDGGLLADGSLRPLSPAAELRRAARNGENVQHPPKTRRVLGVWTVVTPNSSRFAGHWHSRVLQKFPFLIEMFYWIVTFFFYRLTAVLSQVWYGGIKTLWDVAQDHGIALLELEALLLAPRGATGNGRWLEWRVQQWFLAGGDTLDWRGVWMMLLIRSYALIHIPGTVGFIAYYYWAAPNHTRFATVRRTMTLLNLFAFFIFIVYPCMPPRFLPREFGFVDTVSAEDAQSVWMSGKYVNKLAAMPSMHFGYAFAIGCVFIVESGVLAGLRRRADGALFGYNNTSDLEGGVVKYKEGDRPRLDTTLAAATGEMDDEGYGDSMADAEASYRRPRWLRLLLFVLGVWYPSWILLCIIATANHYLLDAVAAAIVVLVSYLCNRVLFVFVPVEDWLLWGLRLEKPVPTTGWVKRDRGRFIR
ncbi:integral membrane protein [Magnaporthiopsis poae ATCC 64411]|uniref:Integral membrane protein n=1 Tax=Magnaporthiopsis poae (strain ATCC 64411 / 73-15) TaxID=644358 RepID=A0A0C4E9F7_MAGP6|nr:integral membrane protein [Magnaporthiopsis poae ATCC 64411]